MKQSLGKPSDEADGEIAPPPPSPVRSSRGDAVCGLYRQGLTERQIAQKTGLGIAEIRFLLKLSNVEGRAAAPAP
ncbi:MAG: hypothetical protein A3I06_03915 [Candidatus Lindowbacteria bacterium RIFCSPLOWO2_02_FULL_62_12]|nr:MAG: hypothetical protein A3I06_03915 [Candidatus Lindowbacteria bacterium RIFCSPLOWO2_02_FULL_62_12]